MKIPPPDGHPYGPNCDARINWKDILCDKCGKSCIDSIGMNYEYASVSVIWGYGSRKDEQKHEAQICEPCYDALGLKPKITDLF